MPLPPAPTRKAALLANDAYKTHAPANRDADDEDTAVLASPAPVPQKTAAAADGGTKRTRRGRSQPAEAPAMPAAVAPVATPAAAPVMERAVPTPAPTKAAPKPRAKAAPKSPDAVAKQPRAPRKTTPRNPKADA